MVSVSIICSMCVICVMYRHICACVLHAMCVLYVICVQIIYVGQVCMCECMLHMVCVICGMCVYIHVLHVVTVLYVVSV